MKLKVWYKMEINESVWKCVHFNDELTGYEAKVGFVARLIFQKYYDIENKGQITRYRYERA